ncbi:hypothetical protein MPTK1_7g15980 [Marchantia polymorpha subsp. ruderalis]|uniref:non-specific serine/threonine protein kinase n=1 Tax=Marchantia polymorpha TaxID=3197 RepID=A7VM44_MARPO|nr:receptor-like kinase [Marchantia polymorpha]
MQQQQVQLLPLLKAAWLLAWALRPAVASNEEGDALYLVRSSLVDPNDTLRSWDPKMVNPCSWPYVDCEGDSVVRVDLGMQGLSGTLAPSIGLLKNLQYLKMQNNHITGPLPDSLGDLTNLQSLDLYQNNFTGEIPSSLGALVQLKFLRLFNNSLSGEIPASLANLSNLQVLDVGFNNLSGRVPVDVKVEQFRGDGNPFLCGAITGNPCPGDPLISPQSSAISEGHSDSESNKKLLGGLVTCVVVVAAVTLYFLYHKHKRLNRKENFFDVAAEDDPEVPLGQLKKFSFRELQIATDNFSSKNILGQGGFGKVYKGYLSDGTTVAVKRLKEDHSPEGEHAFQTEVEMISNAVHRNLLRLQGFCTTPSERILVYPYMPNGSVASHLRASNPRDHYNGDPGLGWPTRKRIALGAARGLSYLHDHCDPKIIHRDVKAANVLLDEEYEAVVGDFGLAKLIDYKDTHVTTAVRGTAGHIAPEYLSTGKSSEKTDVYGYGIMLLELITGQRAYDFQRLANDDDLMLLDWVKRLQHEKKLEQLVDGELKRSYNAREVEELIQVALLCTQASPSDRPKMTEVVRMLEGDGLAERWEQWEKLELVRQRELDLGPHRYFEWVEDSTVNMEAVELSAGR